jgi:hypothetical protein
MRWLVSGVIVVAGRYRSGKSFLMNQLVRADVMAGEGFGIGHTIASHTKGIWMWPTPVRARTSSGDAVDVIVMDSEGLGATEAVRAHKPVFCAAKGVVVSTCLLRT